MEKKTKKLFYILIHIKYSVVDMIKEFEMLPTKRKTCCSSVDDVNVMCKLHRSKVGTPS